MGKERKLDNRIRILIENGVRSGHRSVFLLLGDEAKDQVVILHHILTKATLKARPSVLWCYKKDLGFTTHRKKQMRQLQRKMKAGSGAVEDEDPLELFVASATIRYCYYSETHKILGNTYGMCILQDFEALTPNLLARTMETVEGGGIIVFLVKGMDSLKQLYSLSMDVHKRYRTESQREVGCRFNERFLLSLASCPAALAADSRLNLIPLSTHNASISDPVFYEAICRRAKNMVKGTKICAFEAIPERAAGEVSEVEAELADLKASLKESKAIAPLLNQAKTLDQAKALLKLLDLVTEKSLRQTSSLTAARGRGKSAALGLAMAGAVGFGYSNLFLTAPSPENLRTLFQFVVKGLESLEYQEHVDYEIIQSTNPEFNNAVIRINVFRDHRQTIQYISPSDSEKLGQCELLVVDEAAAIPLPLVRKLLGPYLVFLSSTINGYEERRRMKMNGIGTGRSLSLKLVSQLRSQQAADKTDKGGSGGLNLGRTLHELTLDESIRYSAGDPVEAWLNRLLCLDPASINKLGSGAPSPSQCELFFVNRDTLFSFHAASELFLQRLMSIYVSAHYKNTPNDLQMLSDAPAHQLFCLLGPRLSHTALPEILCVLQVCLEGEIQRSSVEENFSRGKRASGDLIPWTVAQQFQDNDFPSLCGARIVRIATHPDYQRMGYGKRAMEQLELYYRGDIAVSLLKDGDSLNPNQEKDDSDGEETVTYRPKPRKNLPPLLLALTERPPERLNWLGVSFGLTSELLRFWKKIGFVPVYLRQTANDLTGEHSTIMLKELELEPRGWLYGYWWDFRGRILRLLALAFRTFSTSLALSLLHKPSAFPAKEEELGRRELGGVLNGGDLRRLELYASNLVADLLPPLASLVFGGKLASVKLSPAQSAILLGMGLQGKTVETLAGELDVPLNQLLALFNKSVKKLVGQLNHICEKDIERREGLDESERSQMTAQPTKLSLQEELSRAGAEIEAEQARKRKRLLHEEGLAEFKIKAAEDEWETALSKPNPKGILSLKRY